MNFLHAVVSVMVAWPSPAKSTAGDRPEERAVARFAGSWSRYFTRPDGRGEGIAYQSQEASRISSCVPASLAVFVILNALC